MVKNHFENFRNDTRQRQFFKATMNLPPTGVLCIFGNQYIMGRVLSWSVILRRNILQYLMLVLVIFSLDFSVEYVGIESLF